MNPTLGQFSIKLPLANRVGNRSPAGMLNSLSYLFVVPSVMAQSLIWKVLFWQPGIAPDCGDAWGEQQGGIRSLCVVSLHESSGGI